MFKSFRKDEAGTTAIEYALIASLIAVAIIGILGVPVGGNATSAKAGKGLSGSLNRVFADVRTSLK